MRSSLIKFLMYRLLEGFITLAILGLIVFFVSRHTGNPVDLFLGPDVTAEDVARVTRVLGLDQPLYTQLRIFLAGLIRGDFGISFRTRRPVWELVMERLPTSLVLVIESVIFALVIGVYLGVMAAKCKGTWVDTISRLIAVFGMAAPPFWIGMILMQVFSAKLGILPAIGMKGPLSHLLPVLTLGFFVMAGFMRLVRSSMLEVLDSEFAKMARIKGVSERKVTWVHCLRNSLLSVITFAGLYIALLLTGAVVVEVVFAWPGVGLLAYQAVQSRDYNLMQGIMIILGAIVVGISLFIDIIYAVLDPRVRRGF